MGYIVFRLPAGRQAGYIVMNMRCVIILLLLFLPSITIAADIQAGFPPRNIWLSREDAEVGDTIIIYAALHNGSEKKIQGTVTFTVTGKSIGTNEFVLERGKSSMQSVSWSATAGTHSISAKIGNVVDGEGKPATLSNTETGVIEITVTAPPPSPIAEAISTASGAAEKIIASSSPFVRGVTNSILNVTEPIRENGLAYFEKKISERSVAQNVQGFDAPKGLALGTSTQSSNGMDGLPGKSDLWSKAQDAFYKTGLTIFRSAAYFYPFFAILFFAVLYVAIRWAKRRPRIH